MEGFTYYNPQMISQNIEIQAHPPLMPMDPSNFAQYGHIAQPPFFSYYSGHPSPIPYNSGGFYGVLIPGNTNRINYFGGFVPTPTKLEYVGTIHPIPMSPPISGPQQHFLPLGFVNPPTQQQVNIQPQSGYQVAYPESPNPNYNQQQQTFEDSMSMTESGNSDSSYSQESKESSNSTESSSSLSPSVSSSLALVPTKKRYLGVTWSGILLTEGNHCQLCKSNRESEAVYLNHILKDAEGRVVCPVLRSLVCPICKATGDNAHTLKYCSMNPDVPDIFRASAIEKNGEVQKKIPRYKKVRNSMGELQPLKY